MMKHTSKRRRGKKQIEEEKLFKQQKIEETEAKLARLAQMEDEIA